MRRMLALCLALLLAAPLGASAQTVFPVTAGPAGTLVYSQASVSVSNTAASSKIFQYTIPAGFIATSSGVPTGTTSELYTESRSTTPIAVARQPIMFKAVGHLRTNPGSGAAGTADLAVSFGGTAATLAVLNAAALPGSCVNSPVTLEVWISPTALSAASPTSANSSVFLAARLIGPNTSGNAAGTLCASTGTLVATPTVSSASVLGTTRVASPARLNVEWKWSSASHTNSLDIYERVLKIGN